ncbi:MAG: hypothetical protein COA42_22750 [Alteromonadaceae bacterium]|nr:MAG: hypothetical protein COA42_22750 [Alteromonadaceae bacterium]
MKMLANHTRWRIVKYIAASSFVVFAMVLTLLVLTVSTASNISSPPEKPANDQDMRHALALIKKLSQPFFKRQKTVAIHTNIHEVNSLFAFINKRYPRIEGQAQIQGDELQIDMALRFHWFQQTLYLNISGRLESHTGIQWQNIKIGSLSLNNYFSNMLFRKTVKIIATERHGNEFLAGVRTIAIKNQSIHLRLESLKNVYATIASLRQRIGILTGNALYFDRIRVQYYLDYLSGFSRSMPRTSMSLSIYLQLLMKETHLQTQQDLAPATENLYALYALAILLAPDLFQHYIPGLDTQNLKQAQNFNLTLARKSDFAQHFIYSIALEILSSKGVSYSLGEAKELMDSQRGGSGFSFADIAADRAGLKFAELAINSNEQARALQEYCLTGLRERDFFPSTKGLPTRLNRQQFVERYKDTYSPQYRSVIQGIDNRINASTIHQGLIYKRRN